MDTVNILLYFLFGCVPIGFAHIYIRITIIWISWRLQFWRIFMFKLHESIQSSWYINAIPPQISFTVGRVLYSIHSHHRGCLNNPIFSNLGLCAACWAHFLCHDELWPTSVSHPFFSLNSSLSFAGGKHYQKNTIPRLVLQNVAIPGCFSYSLFCRYLFSLLSSGWFIIAVCGSI